MLAQFKRMVFGLEPGWLYAYLTSGWRGVGARGPRQLRALSAVGMRALGIS